MITGLMLVMLAAQAAPDPPRQARQALVQADQEATRAADACRAGEWEKCSTLLEGTQKSVEQARETLDKSGINPQRNPRHHKDAEIRTRKILKVLRALVSYIHPEDRKHYDAVVSRVSEINDYLLNSILVRKKK